MLNLDDYQLAWSIYLLSAFVLVLSVGRLTRRFWVWVKDPLRAVTVVLLFMPERIEPLQDFPAPAIFVIVFESMSREKTETAPTVAVNLLLVCLFAVVAAWVTRAIWTLWRRRSA